MTRIKPMERRARQLEAEGRHAEAARAWIVVSRAHRRRADFWLKVAMVGLAVAVVTQIVALVVAYAG